MSIPTTYIKDATDLKNKSVAIVLLISFSIQLFYPGVALALTSGPSQPEVQGFTPVTTTDMVDVSSGDFNYNIPLLDVDGYPINIAYHSGITMDQEASWVGLGWNVNAGVINRSMRGLPDDFNGEKVIKELYTKPNKTWGVSVSGTLELTGLPKKDKNGNPVKASNGKDSLRPIPKVTLGGGLAFNYNNYNGPSISKSLNLGLGPVSLGIHSSSDEGLTIQPNLSFSKKLASNDKKEISLGISVGSAFNSRSGLKQLSIQTSIQAEKKWEKTGKSVTTGNTIKTKRSFDFGVGGGASFDFGTPTYTPSIQNDMVNYTVTGSFKTVTEFTGSALGVNVTGFFSKQSLERTTEEKNAYGYLYAENGEVNENNLLDFNREKDNAYNPNLPSLAITNNTFDVFSVSGQGAGGSFRPFRNSVGHVFNPKTTTRNQDSRLGVEAGIGAYSKLGLNFGYASVEGHSGKWINNNSAAQNLKSYSKVKNNISENVFFKEANEKTVEQDAAMVSDNFVNLDLVTTEKFNVGVTALPVNRTSRAKRSQNFDFITQKEYADLALSPQTGASDKPQHHIAEISTQGTDGSRYVYGIPAYNLTQREVTFAVGALTKNGTSPNLNASINSNGKREEAETGLVNYVKNVDNSANNSKGVDNYFNRVTTPQYAHSYLLTAVLSADYIDADNVRGPSQGDFGTYKKFNYINTKTEAEPSYKWRVPYEENKANYNEGMKSDRQDDKASYIYGEKELWFLESIETKNYVAKFITSNRRDALGVKDENGGKNPNATTKRLDKIVLYTSVDYKANGANATPIKTVNFEYDYSLCPNVPNNTGAQEIVNNVDLNIKRGKLTLKKIYFTYQNSNKTRLSPYTFDYGTTNPNYDSKAVDRWGNYKPNTATSLGVYNDNDVNNTFKTAPIPNSDYPYVEQDFTQQNQYCQAWTLKKIDLPTGGTITAEYESDDYAYVQNKLASRMFKVLKNKTTGDGKFAEANNTTGDEFVIDLATRPDGSLITDVAPYIDGLKNVYFRFLVNIRSIYGYDHLEYVSGYADLESFTIDQMNKKATVKFKQVDLKKLGNKYVSPPCKTAIQYARLYMSKIAFDANAINNTGSTGNDAIDNAEGFDREIAEALLNSSFIKNIKDAMKGPNKALYDNNVGREFIPEKSWIRLLEPNKRKLGGGLRVTKIKINDNWSTMANSNSASATYGQEYSYLNSDGSSSGVAANEPQLGGDENSLRQPIGYEIEKRMVPNDDFYMEEPLGESYYPSPSIVYGKVSVKNIQGNAATKNKTGYVLHEFYTAKDFPVIAKRTELKGAKKPAKDKFNLRSLLKIDVRDYRTVAQSFVIEVNDMHGKPKKESVYAEGQNEPISSVEYKYKNTGTPEGYKLNNLCNVIYNNGQISTATIGMFTDAIADFNEDFTKTNNFSIGMNIDVIPALAGIPFPIPSGWPSYTNEKTRVRKATTTRLVQRFGMLDETIAIDVNSTVATKTLAYDAETGNPLLTETSTNFNDKIYTLKYPAWWYYTSMGPSYQNVGYEEDVFISNTTGNVNVTNANYFKEGDVLSVQQSNGSYVKGWVTNVSAGTIKVINKEGNALGNLGSCTIKVLNSGYKNLLGVDMANLTTLENPLQYYNSNGVFNIFDKSVTYKKIINASAVEYNNDRKTYCEAFTKANSPISGSTNPYINGVKGNWAPTKTYSYLTARTQSLTNNNSNIRVDGVFNDYKQFYACNVVGGGVFYWEKHPENWTYSTEVTTFNPYGQELENKDALGRYSSATFGYNQSMALSVANNAQLKEQGFDGFEDYNYTTSIDNHFKFDKTNVTIINTDAHSGKYSIKVPSGQSATMTKQLTNRCDNTNCKDLRQVSSGKTVASSVVTITANNPTTNTTVSTATFTWRVINGTPIATANAGILTLTGSNYEIQITVTDGACSATQVYKY